MAKLAFRLVAAAIALGWAFLIAAAFLAAPGRVNVPMSAVGLASIAGMLVLAAASLLASVQDQNAAARNAQPPM